ncbi:MAG: hypothetical protein IKE25_14010 [Clostridia bacterium]|nr:hypothetical protein [Clostridia bacterium]
MRRLECQRAACPRFSERVDYRGRSYIRCGGRNWGYPSKEARDRQYRLFCCGYCRQCRLYDEKGGECDGGAGD